VPRARQRISNFPTPRARASIDRANDRAPIVHRRTVDRRRRDRSIERRSRGARFRQTAANANDAVARASRARAVSLRRVEPTPRPWCVRARSTTAR
jgi:hypothetical protein